VEHAHDHFYIVTNADGAEDFKIVRAPDSDPRKQYWEDFVVPRNGVTVVDADMFAGGCMVLLRGVDGLLKLQWVPYGEVVALDLVPASPAVLSPAPSDPNRVDSDATRVHPFAAGEDTSCCSITTPTDTRASTVDVHTSSATAGDTATGKPVDNTMGLPEAPYFSPDGTTRPAGAIAFDVGTTVTFPAEHAISTVVPQGNANFDATTYNFALTSPLVECDEFCFDTASGSFMPVVAPKTNIPAPTGRPLDLGGRLQVAPFDPTKYVCERFTCVTTDGSAVTVTVTRRRDLAVGRASSGKGTSTSTSSGGRRGGGGGDGSSGRCSSAVGHPTLAVAYGAYGLALEPEFRAEHLPLLERGWVVALCHVRGGRYLNLPSSRHILHIPFACTFHEFRPPLITTFHPPSSNSSCFRFILTKD
jgi:hypothetical protein